MANITLKGEIVAIFDSKILGTSFEKREFWLREQNTEYPQTYNLEMQQGDCNKLDSFKKGDTVECSVSIRGRAYKKKDETGWCCINTLKVWKITGLQTINLQEQPEKAAPGPQPQSDNQEDVPNDDLPF